jgi:beta-lactamase class A
MLHAAIDTQTMTKTFSDLGVDVPNAQKPEDFMSVKQYASFFRILFNATYLNKDYSEKALSLLTKTEFTQGIVSGVPKTVSVSHKFGETRYNNLLQLHDCGIVYFPKKPYLLCIMTRGDNANDLTHVISHLSQSVYEQVSLQMQSNQ